MPERVQLLEGVAVLEAHVDDRGDAALAGEPRRHAARKAAADGEGVGEPAELRLPGGSGSRRSEGRGGIHAG